MAEKKAAAKKPTPRKPANRLIQKLGHMGAGELSDEYFALAYNVEDALLYAGAVPGKDYTYLDLFRLAGPLVLEKFKDGKTEYTYPANRVANQ